MTNLSTGEIKIPKTLTPSSVWFGNIILFLVTWLIFFLLFPSLGWFWNIFITLLLLASTVISGLFTEEVVDFHGALLFNPLKKTRRVIFPGLHLKLPWENMEKGSMTSLLRVVTSSGLENHPTNDPAENMQVSLTVHIRVNVSSTPGNKITPEQAADNFIRFHSIEESALTTIVRKEIVKMSGAFCSGEEMENLLNPQKIQEKIWEINKEKIEEIQNHRGTLIGIVIDSSNPDKETKDLKRTPARAEGLRAAIKKLTENILDEKGVVIGKGLNTEDARRAALLLDDTAEFSEEHFKLEVDAPHLKNLRDFTLLGKPSGEKKGKGKK